MESNHTIIRGMGLIIGSAVAISAATCAEYTLNDKKFVRAIQVIALACFVVMASSYEIPLHEADLAQRLTIGESGLDNILKRLPWIWGSKQG